MLTKISDWAECLPVIRKRRENRDVSGRGSFAFGETFELIAEVPRKLGASAVVLRINKDGEPECDMPLSALKLIPQSFAARMRTEFSFTSCFSFADLTRSLPQRATTLIL